MKTFQQFKEDAEKKFKDTMKTTGKQLTSPLKGFIQSGGASDLLQQGANVLFNKLDGVVKTGNEKYNEVKKNVKTKKWNIKK